MIIRMSHRLTGAEPNWPGAPGLQVDPYHRLDTGDVANTHTISIYNHLGTHVDLPYHFFPDGNRLFHYDVEDFVFDQPSLIELSLAPGELVRPEHLADYTTATEGSDLVLIRSGFESYRADRERFETAGPGFSADAAAFIREHWSEVRAVGIDWLSLCAWTAVHEGTEAHRRLLEARARKGILIFEDMRLSTVPEGGLHRVVALPLLVDQLDGAPCTVIGEV